MDDQQDPAARPVPTEAERAARRTRMQALAGAAVRGSDGGAVGFVRDVYLHDATGELAAVTTVRRQLSSRSVLIPVVAIAELPARHAEADEADPPARAGDSTDTGTVEEPGDAEGTGSTGAPGAAEAAAPQAMLLHIDAATALSGLQPPENAHLSPAMQRDAEHALGLDTPAIR